MKLELSDGMSNNSDFSNDSHNSQLSSSASNDFMAMGGSGLILSQSFISLEGLNSGVPTRTTATLTPTTLRNIEQTFIELQSKPETHENEAHFVPPMVHSIGNNQYISASEADVYTTISNNTSKSNTIWHSSLSQCSSDSNTTSPSPAELTKNQMNQPMQQQGQQGQQGIGGTTRRNMGGRKPNKENNLSPEEEERRKIRRERNKAAAARCRKRRVDHTNNLIEETEQLENKKRALQNELAELQNVRDLLEYNLEAHRPKCRLGIPAHCPPSPPDVKPYFETGVVSSNNAAAIQDRIKAELLNDDDMFPLPSPAKKIMLSAALPIAKPSRPNSLPFNNNQTSNKGFNELNGIPISTPSSGMQFNFDSLMVGGTGLTPVSAPLIPNCSQQQRIPSQNVESPENCVPPKLVSL